MEEKHRCQNGNLDRYRDQRRDTQICTHLFDSEQHHRTSLEYGLPAVISKALSTPTTCFQNKTTWRQRRINPRARRSYRRFLMETLSTTGYGVPPAFALRHGSFDAGGNR